MQFMNAYSTDASQGIHSMYKFKDQFDKKF